MTAKAKQLDGEIYQLMESNKRKYEDYVMGIADKDDLQQCRDEREVLQAELQEIHTRIETLERKNQQHRLFCDVLTNNERTGQLTAEYLQSVTVFTGGRTDIQFIS